MFGIFTPKVGEDEPNLMSIFFKRVDTNHQLVKPELVRKIWTESSTISTLLGGNSKKWGRNFHPDGDMIWANYSDLTRRHPKWWFSKGNPLISGKSRLVKYYNLARYDPV